MKTVVVKEKDIEVTMRVKDMESAMDILRKSKKDNVTITIFNKDGKKEVTYDNTKGNF